MRNKIDDWEEVPVNEVDDWEEVAFEPESTSKLESGLRGLAQGASLGFADELTGALESTAGSLGLVPDKTYEQSRDESRAQYLKAQTDNPVTYGAGQIGGGLATMAIPGLNVAKGASLARTAGTAALQGGLAGLGSSESDDVSQMAKDAAVGAGLGLGLGAAGYGAGKLVEKALPSLREGAESTAERLAARSLGAERGTIKKFGEDKVRAAGRYALDEGIVSPLASTDDMISRNAAVQGRAGEGMREVYKAIDDAGASTFNPLDVASKVDQDVGGFWRSPLNRGETNQLENTLEAILMRGEENIPLSEAQILKQELGKVANWKNAINITDKERMARDAYGVVSSAIDEATEAGAGKIGKDGLLETLKNSKKLYGNSKTAEELLGNKLAREQGNKMFGLTDTIAAGSGLAGGGPLTAGAVYAGKKGLERFGTSTAAVGFDKLADILRVAPERFGKYGKVLQNAAIRGGTSLGAAHYVLQNSDPEYRKMLEEMQDN